MKNLSSGPQTIDLNTRSPSYEAGMWTQCEKGKRIMEMMETGNLKTIF
jgi:hypothetical protein